MIVTAWLVIGYGAFFYAGFRMLAAKKRWLEFVMFGLLAGWCAYIQFAARFHWPTVTPISLQSDMMRFVSGLFR